MARGKLSNGNAPLKSMGVSASQPEKSSFLKSAFKSSFSRPSSSLPPSRAHVDESQTVVINGGSGGGTSQNITIQQLDNAVNGDNDDSLSDAGSSLSGVENHDISAQSEKLTNGVESSASGDFDVKMLDGEQLAATGESEEEGDEAEPSFGDLIARSTKHISIADAEPSDSGALVATQSNDQVAIAPGISLSTVLTQALRTNDNSLLESCLHNTDVQTIRSTIQRIDPAYTGILMQKLAERLASRPGRYGSLLVWVQWICVAHGGAIAARPDVLSSVNTLYRVLNQRSKSLDSLLLLKGKLDMLDSQLDLRRQLMTERGPIGNPREGHFVYVEGEELEDSSDQDETNIDAKLNGRPIEIRDKMDLGDLVGGDEEDSDDDEPMPLTNGVVAESGASDSDSEDDGDVQQEGGLVDDEAEEGDEESEDDISDDSEGSEMDDFIDDGPINEAGSVSGSSLEDAAESPPVAKKRRR